MKGELKEYNEKWNIPNIKKGDGEIVKVETMLAYYLLKLEGYSSREIADMGAELPSYVTINKYINRGGRFWRRLFPLFVKILAILKEEVEEGAKTQK